MSNLRAQATNPKQYDLMNVDWHEEGSYDSPIRAWIREYLQPLLAELKPGRVLDIGCGTGWLSRAVFELGAKSYVGIDPSGQNIDFARKNYPKATLVRSGLETYETGETFDLITCIMTSEHIDNLAAAFKKWHGFLEPGGTLIIIAGAVETFTKQRRNYKLTIENDGEEIVVRTERHTSPTTTDIVRSVKRFNELAVQNGFELIRHIPMTATEALIKARRGYKSPKNPPLMQLLEYKKP